MATQAEKKAAEKAAAKAAAEAAKKQTAAEKPAADVAGDNADWNDEPETETGDEFNGLVKVRCIVDTKPWTDKKALDNDEEATVPEEVAALMLKRKQVVLV